MGEPIPKYLYATTPAHKRIKGDKVVVVCDRNMNVIAPFIEAPGNRNEAILLNPLFKKNKSNGG